MRVEEKSEIRHSPRLNSQFGRGSVWTDNSLMLPHWSSVAVLVPRACLSSRTTNSEKRSVLCTLISRISIRKISGSSFWSTLGVHCKTAATWRRFHDQSPLMGDLGEIFPTLHLRTIMFYSFPAAAYENNMYYSSQPGMYSTLLSS